MPPSQVLSCFLELTEVVRVEVANTVLRTDSITESRDCFIGSFADSRKTVYPPCTTVIDDDSAFFIIHPKSGASDEVICCKDFSKRCWCIWSSELSGTIWSLMLLHLSPRTCVAMLILGEVRHQVLDGVGFSPKFIRSLPDNLRCYRSRVTPIDFYRWLF